MPALHFKPYLEATSWRVIPLGSNPGYGVMNDTEKLKTICIMAAILEAGKGNRYTGFEDPKIAVEAAVAIFDKAVERLDLGRKFSDE